MNPDFERATIRTVIWRLLPLLLLAYLAAYIDRINIGFAGVALKKEFGFSNTIFATGAGLFFIGYFLFEVPSNMLLAKLGARRWILRGIPFRVALQMNGLKPVGGILRRPAPARKWRLL